MSRLLEALAKSVKPVPFTCSVSGVELDARVPTTAQRAIARQAAKEPARSVHEMQAAQALVNRELVRTNVFVDGVAIGDDADELFDPVVEQYAAYVHDAIARMDPEPDTLTDRELEEFETAVKKNEMRQLLMVCDLATMRSYIMHLVGERSRSETSKSSNGGTDESTP